MLLPKNCGAWLNLHGYTLRPTGQWEPGAGYFFGITALWGWRRKRRQYEFTLDHDMPLTYWHPGGFFIQPDRHGFSDLGSIPEQVEPLTHRNKFEPSYLMHDSMCRERGLYFSRLALGPFIFCPVASESGHRLLGMCIVAEGGGRIEAEAIWRACRRFGPRWTANNRWPAG